MADGINIEDIQRYKIMNIRARASNFIFVLSSIIDYLPDITVIMSLYDLNPDMFTAITFVEDPLSKMSIPYTTQEFIEDQCKAILDDLREREQNNDQGNN